ncbi:hypothetical protein GTP56_03840 [Duganella sp. FT134W]|uniref:Helix-turn-helix domain-containing protein n=1 Tax=Duganella margarita TaxID=2692170 RepID=A0A7X4GY37_9BURK|nr:helix-turn-helix domain-containing protein [Duganella margarita]MYM71326.1 hypothetical protein [Duganella margarita]
MGNDGVLKPERATEQCSGTSMSLAHVARQLGTSEKRVLQLVRKGLLKKASKHHVTTHIDRASLMKFLRTLRRPEMIEEHLAAEQLGRSVYWLRTHWGNDIIKIHDFVLGRYVEQAKVDMVAKMRQKYMSSTTACQKLGVDRKFLRSLE